MNCQELEKRVGDLASEQLMQAEIRAAALAHTSECDNCARILSAERSLTKGLRAFAEATAAGQAPSQLKRSLRAAFDARHAKVAVETVAAPNVIQMPLRTRRWKWALTAAALTIVFAVAASIWFAGQSPNSKIILAETTPTPTAIPAMATPDAENLEQKNDPSGTLANGGDAGKTVLPRQKNQFRGQSLVQSNKTETAGNYIPLNYSAPGGAQDDKLVVRVEVPGSTLIAMGLPLNAERGNEMVKADLMVGVDGVPLAIRLIRQ